MKTVNRGALKRKAAAGKLVCVSTYHFDDMHGESRGKKELPVVLKKLGEPFVPGVVALTEWEFKSKSGCAYENKDGTITLIVHSNLNYVFKVL